MSEAEARDWRDLLRALGDPEVERRRAAIARLAKARDLDALIGPLLEAVRDAEDARRRNAALEVIELIGAPIVPLLVRELDRNDDPEYSKFLVDVLGQVGSPLAAPRLATLLHHEDPNLRMAAAEALGRIGSTVGVEALVQRLFATEETTERFVLLEALAKLARRREAPVPLERLEPLRTDPLLVRPLLALVAASEELEAGRFLWTWLPRFERLTLQELAKALGRIPADRLAGWTHHLGLPDLAVAPEDLEALARALDPEIRTGAIWLATWTERPESLRDALFHELLDLEHLRHALPFCSRDALRPLFDWLSRWPQAIAALLIEVAGRLGDGPQLDAVLALAEERPAFRPLAFRWGAEAGRWEVLVWLDELLADPEAPPLLAQGLRALLRRDRRAIVNRLRPWSQRLTATAEWHAFLVLVEELDLVELRGRVETAWRQAAPEIRAQALALLARHQLERTRHYLRLALADESELVRLQACEILTEIADERYREEVRLLLDDREPWIRAEAIRTWVRLEGEAARPALERALADPAAIVRLRALWSASGMLLGEMVPTFRRLTRDPDPDVAAAAITALQRLDEAPEPADAELLDHPDWRVRVAAVAWFADSSLRDRLRDRLEVEVDEEVLRVLVRAAV